MAEEMYGDTVPTQNAPDYLNLFKPAQKQPGSKAGLFAGQGVGTLASNIGHMTESTAKAADAITSEYLQQHERGIADPLQEAHIKELQATFDTLMQGGSATDPRSNAGVTQPGLSSPLGYNKEDNKEPSPNNPWGDVDLDNPPAGLKQELDHASRTQDARLYAKVSGVYADMDMWAAQKHARSMWGPGYRDLVDHTYNSITGRPVANDLVNKLGASIIQLAAGGEDKERTALLHEVQQMIKDTPGADLLANQIAAGVDLSWARLKLGKLSETRQVATQAKYKLEGVDTGDKLATRDALSGITRAVDYKVNASLDANFTALGARRDATIRNIVALWDSNQIPHTQETVALLGQRISQMRAKLSSDIDSYLGDLWTKNGLSLPEFNPAEAKRIKDTAMAKFDNWAGLIGDPSNFTLANLTAKQFERATADRNMEILNGMWGDYAKVTMALGEVSKRPEFAGSVGWQAAVKQWDEQHQNDALAFKNAIVQYLTLGKEAGTPATIEGAMTASEKRFVGTDGKPLDVDYREYFKMITNFKEYPELVRKNYIQSMFGEGNEHVLDHFKRNGIDWRGREIEGKYSVFAQMTYEPFVKQVAKDGGKDLQRKWVEKQVGPLFDSEIRNLSGIELRPGMEWHYSEKDHEIVVHFDQAKAEAYRASRGMAAEGRPDAYRADKYQQAQLEQTASNLNLLVKGLEHVAKVNGTDANTYILKMFQHEGLDLNTIERKAYSPYSAPYSLIKSIMQNIVGAPQDVGKAQHEEMKKEKTKKDLDYSPFKEE